MSSFQVIEALKIMVGELDGFASWILIFLMDFAGVAGICLALVVLLAVALALVVAVFRLVYAMHRFGEKLFDMAKALMVGPAKVIHWINAFALEKGPWVPVPTDRTGPWSYEGSVAGSYFIDRPLPKFQFQVQYLDILGGWQSSGMGCRIGDDSSDFLMMPQHIVKKEGTMRIVTGKGVVHTLDVSSAIMQPGFDPLLMPTPDTLRPHLSKAKCGNLPSNKSIMASIVGPSGHTMGKLSEYDTFGMVKYGASTVAGCSGAPYHDNKTVYGIHIGQYDEDNVGWDATYVFARLIKPESGDYATYWGDKIIQARQQGKNLIELDNGDVVFKYGGKYRRFDKNFYQGVVADYEKYVEEKYAQYEYSGDWTEELEIEQPTYKVRKDRKRGRPQVVEESAPEAVPPLKQAVHVDHVEEAQPASENLVAPASVQGLTREDLNVVLTPAQLNGLATQQLSFPQKSPTLSLRPNSIGPVPIPAPKNAVLPTISLSPSSPAEILKSLLPTQKPSAAAPAKPKVTLTKAQREVRRKQYMLERFQMSPEVLGQLKGHLDQRVKDAMAVFMKIGSNESLIELKSAYAAQDLFQEQQRLASEEWRKLSETL